MVFSPDGLTLSAGGLAATSLKTDHSAFCVLLMRSFLYIQAVVRMKTRVWFSGSGTSCICSLFFHFFFFFLKKNVRV